MDSGADANRARFLRARAIFDEVCELEAELRLERARELAGDDAQVLAQVTELLEADGEENELLGTSAVGVLGLGHAGDAPPARIPGFELGDVIGMGGMGVVYEARQKNPDRPVAVKLLRPGWMTKESLRRFEDEARVLGWLSHPGIATVYEAGRVETAHGSQPYLVMELVRGERVDEYVRRRALDVPSCLSLIAEICRAVHHAHQKGVVHRDLKPANILVTAEGQAKILDFGVARILDPEFESTRNTGAGEMLGTLPYMSPEQVRADPAQIDTRVDVYALGVLSYELLTGSRPHELESFALHEAARVILEEEPTGVGTLQRALRGDVETMVHKAMAKEKERRYASAEEFAQDIRRHLLDEPIHAVPPSRTYLARKFARRHRLVLGAAAAVFLALVAGLAMALRGLDQARAERDQKNLALEEVRRERDEKNLALAEVLEERDQKDLALRESERVSDFLASTLSAVSPKELGRTVSLREVLDEAAPRIEREFLEEPRVAARLFLTVGNTYDALGHIEGAQRYLERAYELSETVGEDGLHESKSLYAHSYGALLRRIGRDEEARVVLTKATEEIEGRAGIERSVLGGLLHELAMLHRDAGELDQAEAYALRSHELAVEDHGVDHPYTLVASEGLAMILASRGKLTEAQPIFEHLLEAHERIWGPDHDETQQTRYNLATLYSRLGMGTKALELDEQTVATRRRVLGDDHPDTALATSGLVMGYAQTGRFEEAEPMALAAIDVLQRELGPGHVYSLTARGALADLYCRSGRLEESLAEYEQMVELSLEHQGALHPNTLRAQMALADVLGRLEDFEPAIDLLLHCLDASEESRGPDNDITLAILCTLGKQYRLAGRWAEAIETLEAVRRRAGPSTENQAGLASGELALLFLGSDPEVRDPLRALEMARAAWVEATRDQRLTSQILAMALFAVGEIDEAIGVQESLPDLLPPMTPAELEAQRETLARYRAALRE